ncbi:alkaline phosphatase D family protein [Bacterioplanes sanyensis]|uniref:alkaline phosphatase D family protein n=1 Tax=Bacterioplanes sanyensis TaxID=1249553 RepID=UPI0016740F61|nr:alkaline phosphatase D family protein [Bacterioplanes sanyensis]
MGLQCRCHCQARQWRHAFFAAASLVAMPLTRREFLLDSASVTALPGLARRQTRNWVFQHGVASGDPLVDGVIIWTRITPTTGSRQVGFRWQLFLDPQCRQLVQQGTGFTHAQRDFTVKLDISGLQPGCSYYYRFEALGQQSDVGRTRTLPVGQLQHLRLAFTSCSNYAQGYFNVYKELASRTDLDAVLHLGDYIYEYDNLEASLNTGRVHCPAHETVSLQDYRQRHACYKRDADLQAVHRQHVFLLIWDDHEVANNAWRGGAEQHQPQQGSWHARLSAAVQAYLEWMPVREQPSPTQGLYRSFRFADLADVAMLDTRLAGRDQPADNKAERDDPTRTLLGYRQERWLSQQLQQAQQQGVAWKLLGQQVMMAQLGSNSRPFNYDQWDGYPAARSRLFDAIEQDAIENVVVLTGDIHSSWALELHRDPFADNRRPLALELVTPAVSSPGIDHQARARLAASSLQALLPHLEFVDFYYRGYVLLDITPTRLQAEWWVVDTVSSPRYQSDCLRCLQVPAGQAVFQPAVSVSPAHAQAPEPAPGFAPELAFLRRWQPSTQQASTDWVAKN